MTKKKSNSEIKFMQAGRTVIATIDGKKYYFTSPDAPKREEIKKLIESYNKLPNDNKKEKIIKWFTPKTQAKLVAAKTEQKKKKNSIKDLERQLEQERTKNNELTTALNNLQNASKTLVEDTTKQAEVLDKVVESTQSVKAPAPVHGHRRSGEY